MINSCYTYVPCGTVRRRTAKSQLKVLGAIVPNLAKNNTLAQDDDSPDLPACISRNFVTGSIITEVTIANNPERTSMSYSHNLYRAGTSYGDSGGPFTCNYYGWHNVLIGIVISMLRGYVDDQIAAVNLYAHVPFYVQWIEEIMNVPEESSPPNNVPTSNRYNLRACWGKIATPRGLINHGRMTSLCGRPTDFKSKLQIYKKKRAFDGYQAQPYSVPWLGQVIRGSHNICGVTLISDESMSDGSTIWAVSAAHCFTTRKVGDTFRVDTGAFIFMFGAYDLRYPTPHIVVRNAQNIIIHPEYDFVINNIALIKFDRKILSNDFVRPICLPLTKIAPMALENCVYCGYSITL
uniref:Peptidase S1 domain-containing protein n=1 Tax=Romanomermis culicivorax TaxID=13658 RepID=A0A915LAH0_ROMCU